MRRSGQDHYVSGSGNHTTLVLDVNGDIDEEASTRSMRSRSPVSLPGAKGWPALPARSRSHSIASNASIKTRLSDAAGAPADIGIRGLAEQLELARTRGFSKGVIEIMEKEREDERKRKQEAMPAGVKLDQARARLERACNKHKKVKEDAAAAIKSAHERLAEATNLAEQRVAAAAQEVADASAALDLLGPADTAATVGLHGELAGAIQGIIAIAQCCKDVIPPELAAALEHAVAKAEKVSGGASTSTGLFGPPQPFGPGAAPLPLALHTRLPLTPSQASRAPHAPSSDPLPGRSDPFVMQCDAL